MALSKVLEAGLEPARPKEHRILSPACLPIPPLEHLSFIKDGRKMSGRRDSNPRPQPWQGCALPTELLSLIFTSLHSFIQRATNL